MLPRSIATPGRLIGLALAVATVGTSAAIAASTASADNIEGKWYDDSGKGAVEITKCGSSLCGHIVWLKDPLKANGDPLTDQLNPKTSKRNRPICGLQVIGGVAPQNDGSWDNGWIYDPKAGKAYNVALFLDKGNVLKVHGYLALKMMGKTLSWKRAPADLPQCK